MARNPDPGLGKRAGLLSVEMETKQFNKFVQKFIRESKKDTEIAIKKIAFDLLRKILMKTPKKTGRAQSGWYPSFEGLGHSAPGSTLPGDGKFVNHLRNVSDKYVIMINSVKYIMYLEFGSSSQASAGMARVSMREMMGTLPKEISDKYKKTWDKRSKQFKISRMK